MTYTQPLILLFGLAALAGLWRMRRGQGWGLAAGGVAALLLLAWPPVDWLISRPLEAGYPVRPYEPQPAGAIVVLSAAVEPPHFERPYYLADAETFGRCEYARWVHQARQALPILACGGPGGSPRPYSATMRELLERGGVPPAMIWTEDRSRNTHENATFGAAILRAKGIGRVVLITDAKSMPRAAACFRKEGIAVVPAPSSFREFGPLAEELMPGWAAIARNEATLHEVAGLAWYRMKGWI